MVGPGLSRPLNFKKIDSLSQQENEEFFANVVRELSGDWITQIECDDI